MAGVECCHFGVDRHRSRGPQCRNSCRVSRLDRGSPRRCCHRGHVSRPQRPQRPQRHGSGQRIRHRSTRHRTLIPYKAKQRRRTEGGKESSMRVPCVFHACSMNPLISDQVVFTTRRRSATSERNNHPARVVSVTPSRLSSLLLPSFSPLLPVLSHRACAAFASAGAGVV